MLVVFIVLTVIISAASSIETINTRDKVIENGCGEYNNTTGN